MNKSEIIKFIKIFNLNYQIIFSNTNYINFLKLFKKCLIKYDLIIIFYKSFVEKKLEILFQIL